LKAEYILALNIFLLKKSKINIGDNQGNNYAK